MDFEPYHILIVDDDVDILKALRYLLEDHFNTITTCSDPNEIPEILKSHVIDIIILDLNFELGVASGQEGMNWMKYMLEFDEDMVVIIITAYGDIELAVNAVRQGAFDFIPKPWENEKMLSTIYAACHHRKTKIQLKSAKNQQEYYKNEWNKNVQQIIMQSPKMKEIIDLVKKSAPTDANILLTGENGTGKSLIAQHIHNLSSRKNQSFINVDLGALPESLLESELFGYVSGAFTDAKKNHPGRFEVAQGGTIFLDEITNLPVKLQPKLLSVIQNRKVTRLGSIKEIPLDIRIISATNKKIPELLDQKRIREDLLYRIKTIEIELPPLRERLEDIPELAQFFINKFKTKYHKKDVTISQNALLALQNYPWPGNIRELEHCIEKGIIFCHSSSIEKEDLGIDNTSTSNPEIGANESLEVIEKKAIQNALHKHKWNISEAARQLQISRQSIYNKMKKYDL